MARPQLILASASPRRRELLAGLGVEFLVRSADIDESLLAGELPADYVQRVAREKAERVAAASDAPNLPVLAADTSVVLEGQVLGKPRDRGHAREMLAELGGRQHQVLTAVCLRAGGSATTRLVRTGVTFCALAPDTIERYLATPEPWDKAGAYGIQGLAGAFVTSISGSYSNVVGLPLYETWQLLRAAAVGSALDPAPGPE